MTRFMPLIGWECRIFKEFYTEYENIKNLRTSRIQNYPDSKIIEPGEPSYSQDYRTLDEKKWHKR